VRSRQIELLEELDRLQVPYWDGTRSLKEWIAGRLDMQPRNAADIAVLAKAEPGPIRDSLRVGVGTVDRAAAMARLANTGADDQTMAKAEGVGVGQVGQLAARHRRVTHIDEAAAFRARRLWFQPSLGNTMAVGSFAMLGADMEALVEAVDRRADEIVDPADPHRPTLEQRRIDALTSLALDIVSPQQAGDAAPARRRLKAHIFIDAGECSRTDGEAGAITRSGVKVGPATLHEILCVGETQTTVVTADGLKAVRTDGDRLPNRTRDFVFSATAAALPTAAPVATASSPITYVIGEMVATTIRTTSPCCAGSTTMLWSIKKASASISIRHGAAADSWPLELPGHRRSRR
jgi:hypothetical protein